MFSAKRWAIPSKAYMDRTWSYADLIDAHIVLDMYEQLDAEQERLRANQT